MTTPVAAASEPADDAADSRSRISLDQSSLGATRCDARRSRRSRNTCLRRSNSRCRTPDGWSAALASVGAIADRLMRVKQVHGNVRARPEAGASRRTTTPRPRPDGDAIVSNVPGLVLAVMVADCVPILLADRETGAAAAIHAGWRGTCARVAPTAVEAMRREFGTRAGGSHGRDRSERRARRLRSRASRWSRRFSMPGMVRRPGRAGSSRRNAQSAASTCGPPTAIS